MTKFDRSVRVAAAALWDGGLGWDAAGARLGVSPNTVRKRVQTYRAVGLEGLVATGSRTHGWETKVAAARAVVERGEDKQTVMAAFGIASKSPLDAWCRRYREGGAEALRPKPRGRPKGSPAPRPLTREERLEREVARLEAEVAV